MIVSSIFDKLIDSLTNSSKRDKQDVVKEKSSIIDGTDEGNSTIDG